jgi:hypothetical protein
MPTPPLNWQRQTLTLPAGHPLLELLAPPPVTTVAMDVPDLSQWPTAGEKAALLLRKAAEIEHALLVQYLYAGFSLRSRFPEGQGFPSGAANSVAAWRNTILGIAREEMGHLMSVQNLFHLLGLEVYFTRADLPQVKDLYPFELHLGPLTQKTLARYVVAEMPASAAPQVADIIQVATSQGTMPVNRVGVLYALLGVVFTRAGDLDNNANGGDGWYVIVRELGKMVGAEQDPTAWHLPGSAFQEDTQRYQASADDWGDDLAVHIHTVATRHDALEALRDIAEQGEGPWMLMGGSHFERFRDIYRGKEDQGQLPFPAPGEWIPTLDVPTDPVLPTENNPVGPDVITNARAQRWARLFDLRYQMLVACLDHFLRLDGPLYLPSVDGRVVDTTGDRTGRGFLNLWAFDEMRRLRKIAGKLAQLPRHEDATASPRAGAPFTLELPQAGVNPWRRHFESFLSTQRLVQEMQATDNPDRDDPFLAALVEGDRMGMAVAEAELNGTAIQQPRDYQKVARILEEAVHGIPIGPPHRAFWQHVKLEGSAGFVTLTPVADVPLLIRRNGPASNLVKALRGEQPFDMKNDRPVTPPANYPRMPKRRQRVPQVRIDYISWWIDQDCPDRDRPGEETPGPEPEPTPEP